MKYKKALMKIVENGTGNIVKEGDVFSLKTVHIVEGITWIHIEPLKDDEVNFPELITAEAIANYCEEYVVPAKVKKTK